MKFTATIRKEGAPDDVRAIEAPSRFAVYDQVQKEGGTVVALEDASARWHAPAWLSMTIGTGVKRAEVIRLAKNLSAMLTAGLPLSRGLSVIERQSGNKNLKKVVVGIAESIKRGSSFNEALAAYPKVFNSLFISMAREGEESGGLADALAIVGTQMERSEELSKKVKGAMIYPSIVVTAIVIVGILMMIFVVPTLTQTFVSLHVQVPLSTRIIVAISDFMVGNILLVIAGLAALVIGGFFFFRSAPGGATVLWAALKLPVVGELVRETYAARFARTISSLLSSGVPVLDALDITKQVVHARVFARVIEEAEGSVKKGEPLSKAFAAYPKLYPILMSDMLSVGEETGKMAEMLKQIAEYYEGDVAEKTKDLSTIIEPVLMLFIGTVVGIFAVSIIAPIYSLSSAIGN